MDIFTEFIVKKKKETADYLIAAGLIFAALLLTFIFLFTIVSKYLFGMGLLLAVGAWWGAIYLIRMRNVEFEYILTNAELDVDKIMARRRRKRVISVNFKEIEVCARIHDPDFKRQYDNKEGVTILNLAGDLAEENVYFADFSKDGAKKRILFQPNEKIIESVKKLNPRAVNL